MTTEAKTSKSEYISVEKEATPFLKSDRRDNEARQAEEFPTLNPHNFSEEQTNIAFDPLYLFRLIEKERWRNSVERFLHPLEGYDLPGRAELEQYVRYKYRRNMKANTLYDTVSDGIKFLSFIQKAGRQNLQEVKREDLEAFVEQEQDRGLKPASVRKRLASARSFLNYLLEEGVVTHEVLSRKIQIKLPQSLPKAIDPEDVKRLLEALDHRRDRALLLVLLRTGMRIGELLKTKVEDVSLAERKINIYEGEKNAIGRVVYLSEDACSALQRWMDSRDTQKSFLFYGQGRGSLGYASARVVFNKYVDKAGLPCGKYTLHCLRHTFASEMLNAGMRLECLQQILGHTQIKVTRLYARLTDKTREEEYFRAMTIIERGEIHGHYQLDSELQEILEEKKLLD